MGTSRQRGQWRRARHTVRIALVACAMLIPLAVPQAASAALSTCESNTTGHTYHAGFVRPTNGTTAYGVKATITAKRGSLCGSDLSHTNFNAVYVLIGQTEPDSDGIFGWAQVGYQRFATEYTYHFYQYRHGNPPPGDPTADIHTEFYFGAVAGDVAYDYAVRYNDPCSCLVMGINGSIIASTDFDPFSSWYDTGSWHYEIAAESQYKASDMPGSSTDKVQITKMLLFSSVNQYYTMPCGGVTTYNDNPSRWATNHSTCNTGQIWTP